MVAMRLSGVRKVISASIALVDSVARWEARTGETLHFPVEVRSAYTKLRTAIKSAKREGAEFDERLRKGLDKLKERNQERPVCPQPAQYSGWCNTCGTKHNEG